MLSFINYSQSIYLQRYYKIRGFLLIVIISLFTSFFMMNNANASQPDITAHNDDKKVLIIYYSRSGNTGDVAQHIHHYIGGDLVQIETVNPYPEQYRATTQQAKRELEEDFRPELKTKISHIADYDVIFIGSPNWWGTLAMPVRTFLYDYDLSGKILIPFMTHEGSGFGRSIDDLKKFQPKATILEGIALRGNRAKQSQTLIQQWLTKIGMVK